MPGRAEPLAALDRSTRFLWCIQQAQTPVVTGDDGNQSIQNLWQIQQAQTPVVTGDDGNRSIRHLWCIQHAQTPVVTGDDGLHSHFSTYNPTGSVLELYLEQKQERCGFLWW